MKCLWGRREGRDEGDNDPINPESQESRRDRLNRASSIKRFNTAWDQNIVFYTTWGQEIVNFPKQHSENLTSRHQLTGSWLKPMVRILKNMRSRLVDKGTIEAGTAPSYCLEGLLYNVPHDKFGKSYSDCFCKAIDWLNATERSKLVCAHEQCYLLHRNSHTSWDPDDCDKLMTAVTNMWLEW